jgi:hypothetical protein
MTTWTNDELNTIGAEEELIIAGLRTDDTLRKPVVIWVVRIGDDLYVRSVKGHAGAWFRGVQERHAGHIQTGGVDKDVILEDIADADLNAQIDAAFLSKYRRYPSDAALMVTPEARSTSLKLIPRN